MKQTNLQVTVNLSLNVTGEPLERVMQKVKLLEEAITNTVALGFGTGEMTMEARIENESVPEPPPARNKPDDILRDCMNAARSLKDATRNGEIDATNFDARIAEAAKEIADKHFG